MAGWFYTRRVLPGVWLVGEPQHVYCWLVEGSERAVLLDTGLGFESVRPVVEDLTDRPVSVINTHYHFDHIGGNHAFERIAIHEAGAALIEAEVPHDVLAAYVGYAERQLEAVETYRPLDRDFFWLLSAESDPRRFPDGFNAESWRIRPSRADETLADGDRVDLGGRVLSVLHTPGHSPDGISLFDEREGLLFVGDAFNAGPVYAHFPDSDLRALAATSRRLASLVGGVRLIAAHHYGRLLAEPDLLVEYAEALERVVGGHVELAPARDVLGDAMLEARFDHFTITVPDPEAQTRPLTAATVAVS